MDMRFRIPHGSGEATSRLSPIAFLKWCCRKPLITWVCISALVFPPASTFLQTGPYHQAWSAAVARVWDAMTAELHAAAGAVMIGVQAITPPLETVWRSLTLYRCLLLALGFAMVIVQLYRAIRDIRAAKGHLGTAAACAMVVVLYYAAHIPDVIT